jgi:hypothetical protein
MNFISVSDNNKIHENRTYYIYFIASLMIKKKKNKEKNLRYTWKQKSHESL